MPASLIGRRCGKESLLEYGLKNNITPTLEIWTDFLKLKYPAIVMPWADYGNLSSFLSVNRSYSEAGRLTTLNDIAAGLRFLHTLNPPILHGDLKTNNVLIFKDRMCASKVRACVSDFGCSRALDGSDDIVTYGLPFTKKYRAPEVNDLIGGKVPLTLATDVHAFGCVIIEVLTGNAPFHKLNDNDDLDRALERDESPADPDHLSVTLLRASQYTLIKRCTAFVPDMRPSSDMLVREVGKLLEEVRNNEE